MNADEFRIHGKEVVDYIADYLENIRDRKVFPDTKPGFLRTQIPDSAPVEGESWRRIFEDFENLILPGVTHWQSPHMHGYFPALVSYPSILGDLISSAINCIGFTWASSPVCTELETIVMNWLGKMIGLPDTFLCLNRDSLGGGVIHTTASEASLTCLLAGRRQAISNCQHLHPNLDDAEINGKLIAYCSDQAHSSIEKAGIIALVKVVFIESDDQLAMRGDKLLEAIKKHKEMGLIPFWVCATLGSTSACSFDNLDEIGTVCQQEKLWLHIDAAYAGSAFLCPEYRVWLKGVEKADSIVFNPSKWMLVHFDCTALWVKDSTFLHKTFNVNPLYLQHENTGLAIDYMHWQIPLSRRFRSLKLWFVIRNYGITGLQRHIREAVRLAKKFEALVLSDPRFEISFTRYLGLVTFRLKGDNELTEMLLQRTNSRGNIHCVPASLKNKYVIRFTVTSQNTTIDDILKDWKEIKTVAAEILSEMQLKTTPTVRVPLKETRERKHSFGTSLLLSNSPMSPKIVNGSFAAIFHQNDILESFSTLLAQAKESPYMRRRLKGILMYGRQFSLDSRLDFVHGMEVNSTSRPTSLPPNAPLLEASNESDTSPTEEEEENDKGQLHVPQRYNRSKSVDDQASLLIPKEVFTKCTKCGHDVELR